MAKHALIYVDNHYNDLEFWYPKLRLTEAGAAVSVVGAKKGATYTSKYGLPVTADLAYADVDTRAVDGLVIPGGYAPDMMRRHDACLTLTRQIFDKGAPVAFICHAGWVAASAGIVSGKRCTSFFSIKDDMTNAGAAWEDAEVVVDENLISSRQPDDLPAFMRALLKQMGL